MANQLKMAMLQAIITLLERGWSYRRIARGLGIHRETVARYDRERSAKPAISTPGSESADALHGPRVCRPPGRPSACDAYAEIVRSKVEAGLTAQRIFQDLRTDTGFTGESKLSS